MPSMVSVEFAARKIIRDLVKLKYEVAFPFMFTFFKISEDTAKHSIFLHYKKACLENLGFTSYDLI